MGKIENFYTLKVANKTEEVRRFSLQLNGINAHLLNEALFIVDPGELRTFPVTIVMDPLKITQASSKINFSLISAHDPRQVVKAQSKFLGPVNY